MKTNKKLCLSALAFIAVASVVTFIAWCGGYNFTRGESGFMCAFMSIGMGAIAAAATFTTIDL